MSRSIISASEDIISHFQRRKSDLENRKEKLCLNYDGAQLMN